MTDLRTTLQSLLGTDYTLERELGGGGMSRVFLATENRFSRRVVVKLLAPALADGLSAERFTREISLAASLQQANIVPLLSAGDADGLPWYSMPYVEGQSLRDRLEQGPVSQDQATSVLRDVARALAYAHERGIVHRDIKPENILLSGGAAVVTDFGIAKALSAARTAAPNATLTQIGTSIGTPAYMAPEQAIGGEVDLRADVYAWGVVAYELLAGRHPFTGKTSPQQLVAAHVAEQPAPLPATIAMPLAALVQRALAKEPDARPASGQQLLELLDVAVRGSTGAATAAAQGVRTRRTGRWIAAGLTTITLALGAAWFFLPAQLRTLVTRPSAPLMVNRVVVSPLTNGTGDASLDALGGLASAYLTESLSQLPGLQLVDAQTAAAGSAIVGSIPRLLRRANERALADETGAAVVVSGGYYLEDGQLSFRVRVLDGTSGALRQSIPVVMGSRDKPTAALTLLASRVAGALAISSDREGAGAPPALAPSLEAWQAWQLSTKGYLQDGDTNAVLTPLRTALEKDSTWATGFSSLAFYAWGVGDLKLADSALARGARVPPPIPSVHRAMQASLLAQAQGDAAGGLRAAQDGLAPQYVAFLAYANARPRLTIATILSTDPDRGLNLMQPALYFDRLLQSYLWLGEWTKARAVAREWQRREPRRRGLRMETDAYIAAVQGDANAVEAQLQQLTQVTQRGLTRYSLAVVNATTLLRTRGGKPDDAARIVNAAVANLSPPSELTESRMLSRTELLIAAERWPEALAAIDAWSLKLDSLQRAGRAWPRFQFTGRSRLNERRAVVLLHLQRTAEALAIDSAFALSEDARWDQGHSALARAAIAAHQGDFNRAVALLQKAIRSGATGFLDYRAYPSIEADPLFVQLRNDPRFKALAKPDPTDG